VNPPREAGSVGRSMQKQRANAFVVESELWCSRRVGGRGGGGRKRERRGERKRERRGERKRERRGERKRG